jgi:SAM-dependent methyltransferase
MPTEVPSEGHADNPLARRRPGFSRVADCDTCECVSIDRLSRDWDELAEQDALFVVLAEPGREGGKWELEEFYATGEREIAQMLVRAGRLGRPAKRGQALDFGAGVGRLTRALSAHFDECVGVDVSAEMVRRARELNADRENCRFVHSVRADLSQFENRTFDLVYSSKVLQHLPNHRLVCAYIQEFLRVTKPDGLVAFQLWTRLPFRNRLQPRRRAYAALRLLRVPRPLLLRLGLSARGRGLALPEAHVRRTITERGGTVLLTEPDGEWGLWYFAAPRHGEEARTRERLRTQRRG